LLILSLFAAIRKFMIRFFDILLTLLGLVFGLPILLLLTVIGFFDTGSPVFRQMRVGRKKSHLLW
jgi:O-antigen biosynthesis protein WbqP